MGIEKGDVFIVEVEGSKIIPKPLNRTVSKPLEELLDIFKKSLDIDAVKLVENSWEED